MFFGFEKIMDFAMDTDKLNLVNLVRMVKVMDKIMEFQIFCQGVQLQKLTNQLCNTTNQLQSNSIQKLLKSNHVAN